MMKISIARWPIQSHPRPTWLEAYQSSAGRSSAGTLADHTVILFRTAQRIGWRGPSSPSNTDHHPFTRMPNGCISECIFGIQAKLQQFDITKIWQATHLGSSYQLTTQACRISLQISYTFNGRQSREVEKQGLVVVSTEDLFLEAGSGFMLSYRLWCDHVCNRRATLESCDRPLSGRYSSFTLVIFR
jgi:hypothetical protein